MQSSNPTLRDGVFTRQMSFGRSETMTVNGTIARTAVLFLLMAAAALYTWQTALGSTATNARGLGIAGGLVAMALSLVISFVPRMAPWLAPVFAVAEGLFLGAISAAYASLYSGIVSQALMATIAIFAAMLFVYRTGIIKVTDKFRAVVSTAFMGIFFIYLLTFVLGFFGTTVPYIHQATPIGIAFSAIVLVVVSFMLLLDFDMIERGAAAGAPKYMEWYGGFALLVTVVWIYLEMLRLLAKLRDR